MPSPIHTRLHDRISANLLSVRQRIAAACERVGRSPDSVRLIAVTKYASADRIRTLARLHSHFGESRPQQLTERAAALPGIQWHLIGQLQRNKVRSVLPHVAMIHSADSLRLLQRIESVAEELQRQPAVLLQVNVTGEESKSGFSPSELRQEWAAIRREYPHLRLQGLMTMAAASADPEDTRACFRDLRNLRDELRASEVSKTTASSQQQNLLPHLSMGMSGDFEVAVEEGATLVRIGSLLFEGTGDGSHSADAGESAG